MVDFSSSLTYSRKLHVWDLFTISDWAEICTNETPNGEKHAVNISHRALFSTILEPIVDWKLEIFGARIWQNFDLTALDLMNCKLYASSESYFKWNEV